MDKKTTWKPLSTLYLHALHLPNIKFTTSTKHNTILPITHLLHIYPVRPGPVSRTSNQTDSQSEEEKKTSVSQKKRQILLDASSRHPS